MTVVSLILDVGVASDVLRYFACGILSLIENLPPEKNTRNPTLDNHSSLTLRWSDLN